MEEYLGLGSPYGHDPTKKNRESASLFWDADWAAEVPGLFRSCDKSRDSRGIQSRRRVPKKEYSHVNICHLRKLALLLGYVRKVI